MYKILSLFIFIMSVLHAHFAHEEETNYEVEKNKQTYKIHKDGSYEVTTETIYLIKNETGRDKLSKSTTTYAESTEKFEILDAKTIVDNKEYQVPK